MGAPCLKGGGGRSQVAGSDWIESPFATVRLRQRVTKGAGSPTKGLLMAYKLLEMAQARWRRLDGAHLLPLVRAGITFVDGLEHVTTGRRSSPRGLRDRSDSGLRRILAVAV